MPEIIATITLIIAISALLSCTFWCLWEKDLKEMNEAAEREAWK